MDTAGIMLLCAGAYAAIGAAFASVFVTVGVARVDHAAAGAPWAFRVVIWPGAAALWPWMLRKWVRAGLSQDDGWDHA